MNNTIIHIKPRILNSKILFYCVFLFVLMLTAANDAFAKRETTAGDTIASLVIDNIRLTQADEMLFKLRLLRHSDNWSSYANGTYQLVFNSDDAEVDPDSMSIEFTGNTDLKMYIAPGGGSMPVDGYAIESAINENKRISIMVAGPEEFKDARFVPKNDSGIVIGEFRL